MKNAPCRPRWRARRAIVVFTTKLMKKPLCAMPLRYVRVVLNYQEESPPISHWDRGVIPLGWSVASCDFGGAVQYLGVYSPLRDCCRESRPLFIVPRYRTPSSLIHLSEEVRKPFALLQAFLLSSGGKSALLVKEKVPSRSGFSASTHVVLKPRHVNPNIHVRRY